jgi:transketolase
MRSISAPLLTQQIPLRSTLNGRRQCAGAYATNCSSSVLPAGVPRVSVEAATSFGWDRYADAMVSIDRFGASAPGPTVMTELGITPEHVVECARALLGART